MAKGMPTGAKPKAHYPRRVHDFSARRVYTSKAGSLIPVKPIHSIPNEHLDIDVSDFLQSMPLATAAFLRGRKEFAFYYVPYVQLWSNFGQYMSGRADKFSSALKGHEKEPRISLRLMYELVLCAMLNELQCRFDLKGQNSKVGEEFDNNSFSLTDSSLANPRTWSFDVSFTLLQHTFAVVDGSNQVVSDITPTRKEFAYDRFGLARWSNMARKLDMLRYGNMLPYLSPLYDAVVDYFSGSNDYTTSDLSELLSSALYQIKVIPTNYYVSPLAILAYNKVFYTFFRNSYYELDYYVGDYNVDALDCSSLETSILDNSMFSIQFLDIYQHQWKKDMFTSLMPDTQFGAVSTVELSLNAKSSSVSSSVDGYAYANKFYLDDYQFVPGSTEAIVGKNTELADTSELSLGVDVSNEFYSGNIESQVIGNANISSSSLVNNLSVTPLDVLALRRAEAIQGYRQTLLRCGNKTKDIMVGIYGVEPVWENDHDPAFIDAFGYDFAVDRVMQTATTDNDLSTYNGKLGDLGGQIASLGGSKHHIKFTTRGDFGVVLPITYTIFESEYNSYNIDQNNLTLTPEDRFIPDYMNLGFVPVTRRTLSLLDPVVNRTSPAPSLDAVLGYGTRYFEKKIDIDLVHGILCSFGVYDPRHPDSYLNQDFGYFGDFAHWVAPRTDMQSALVTSTKQFYIDPRILNGNFLLAADGRQETDQFICNTYFKVIRTNIISDLGLPQF